jgi:hypothetical protein
MSKSILLKKILSTKDYNNIKHILAISSYKENHFYIYKDFFLKSIKNKVNSKLFNYISIFINEKNIQEIEFFKN